MWAKVCSTNVQYQYHVGSTTVWIQRILYWLLLVCASAPLLPCRTRVMARPLTLSQ